MVKLLDVQTMLAFGAGMIALLLPRRLTTAGLFLGEASLWADRARVAVLLVLLPVVLLQVLSSDYSPFLYFQF